EAKQTPRYCTAVAVAALVKGLSGRDTTPRLQAVAKASLNTTPQVMGTSLSTAPAVGEALGGDRWELLSAVGRLQDERQEQGQAILDRVRTALAADELTTGLGAVVQEAQHQ